jgi:hypothetical protein
MTNFDEKLPVSRFPVKRTKLRSEEGTYTGAFLTDGEGGEGTAIVFRYEWFDSDEGTVFITYSDTEGGQIDPDALRDDASFDVSISTASDTWGLEETSRAITAALKMHREMGHDVFDLH